MSSQGKFMIFCAEQYKRTKRLTGKQLAELVSRYRVWEYIYSCYEALPQRAQIISSRISIYILKPAGRQWRNLQGSVPDDGLQ